MVNKDSIIQAFNLLVESFSNSGKLLLAGNGGSASDCDHIAGELMKSFVLPRKVCSSFFNPIDSPNDIKIFLEQHLQQGLPSISLSSQSSLISAISNDTDASLIFAQQVMSLGNNQDAFWGISTSGNSRNVLLATIVAKAKGIKTICLTGNTGGMIANIADCVIAVPEVETYKIQELHLPIYHTLCLMLEEYFYKCKQ